jgi:hypothetical protein
MPRRDARAINPSLSTDARDKLHAAINWDRTRPDTVLSAEYREACLAWFTSLCEADRWRVAMVHQAHDKGRHGDAEQMAAALPPAPRCPL